MDTFLFHETVFGPIRSRRLGASLGINLLPTHSKWCNFDCIYCECGYSHEGSPVPGSLVSVGQMEELLDARLKELVAGSAALDAITFAGNGEPSLHPRFGEMVDVAIRKRDEYFPKARIAVLSNASLAHIDRVFEALRRVDENILKLDSAIEETLIRINRPPKSFSLERLKDSLRRFGGGFTLQTMFLRAQLDDGPLDNSSEMEVAAWLELLDDIRPGEIMIYSVARATPLHTVSPVDEKRLREIGDAATRKGYRVMVSA